MNIPINEKPIPAKSSFGESTGIKKERLPQTIALSNATSVFRGNLRLESPNNKVKPRPPRSPITAKLNMPSNKNLVSMLYS